METLSMPRWAKSRAAASSNRSRVDLVDATEIRPPPRSGPAREEPEVATDGLRLDPAAVGRRLLGRGDEPGGDGADDVGRGSGAGVETELPHVDGDPFGGDEPRTQVVGAYAVPGELDGHDA